MSENNVYKSVEITGSAKAGVTEAIDNAIGKAGSTLRNIEWFEVTQIRGHVDGAAVGHYQVTLKVGFKLD